MLNERQKDGFYIVDSCASNCNKHPRLLRYLMKNNDKLGWKIDFNETNVLILFGNYANLREIFNKHINFGICRTTKADINKTPKKHISIEKFSNES